MIFMISQNRKLYSILAYIWILWIVGLACAPDDPVVKRRVNEGLNLFLIWTLASILAFIPILDILGSLLYILAAVLMVFGIVSVVKDDDKPLPILSIITLIR